MNESLAQLRTYRLNSGELRRGSPRPADSIDGCIDGMAFALFGFVSGAIGWVVYTQQLRGILTAGGLGGMDCLFRLWPVPDLRLVWFIIAAPTMARIAIF